MNHRILAGWIGTSALAFLTSTQAAVANDWPQFRGPNASGVAPDAQPPVRISPTNGVLWKLELPWSPSSPCVSDDLLFVTTWAQGELQTRAYDRNTGNSRWTSGVRVDHLEGYHGTDGSPAASTPAAGSGRVVSYFGSFGLVCYDPQGKELWRHPLPVARSHGSYGTGTSPILVSNLVILSRDQYQDSSLLALDLATGKTVWETSRPETVGAFSTPVLWNNDGMDQVVLPGSLRLKAYDLKTGKESWRLDGLPGLACTTPVVGDGMLFFAGWSPGKADSPWPTWEAFLEQHDKNKDGEITFDEFDERSRDFYKGLDRDYDNKLTRSDWDAMKATAAKAENVLLAVKPGGRGEITQTHVVWKYSRGLPYVPSPLFYEGRVYLIKDGGMLSCFDARTGNPFYTQERLNALGTYYASPVAAAGRVYLASLSGTLSVVRAGGDKPEILHQADFGDRIFATPALVKDRLYLRTQRTLYAFGETSETQAR